MSAADTWGNEIFGLGELLRSVTRQPRAKRKPVRATAEPRPPLPKKRTTFYLTRASQKRVLASAESVCRSMERALLYRLAADKCLRANELRSLTRGSFDLNGSEPTVTVQAAYSERRRTDVLPLLLDMANAMRTILVSKLPGAVAFNMPPRDRVAKI